MDIDRLLTEAGGAWRKGQAPPPAIDRAMYVRARRRVRPLWLMPAAGIAVALTLVVGVMATRQPDLPSSGVAPAGADAGCTPTRPASAFVPPSPYEPSPPAYYGSAWFGSAALWTMLSRDGEVWSQSGLPHRPGGLFQKIFWWSADWSPGVEPQPAISVIGRRLDGSGSFKFGPGTNAAADFGSAMLVGIEIPTPGCWELTGHYRGATLSFVVWIKNK